MWLQGSGVRAFSATILAALAIFLLPATAESKTKPCKYASLSPKSAAQMKRVSIATRCLVNRERTKRGLKRLAYNADLQEASVWQGQDMIDYAYFDHQRDGGPEFSDRILQFGYADGANGYMLGENIAWASASIATPKKIVKLWMNSPPHRQNILTRAFREQGLAAIWSDGGVGGAYANSGGPFVIYVNQFGRRY